jgi:dihydrofolate reductase
MISLPYSGLEEWEVGRPILSVFGRVGNLNSPRNGTLRQIHDDLSRWTQCFDANSKTSHHLKKRKDREPSMSKVRIQSFSISLDGFGAGPQQDLHNPLGVGGLALHEWVFPTRTFRRMHGGEGGSTGIDDEFAARGFNKVGAWILGRNMFGPIRGPWPENDWKGWWGDNPPYHTDVFVLTHHPRESIAMNGGTTFHFVTEGIHAALQRASEAARGLDIRLGGGVATLRQYLQAGLVDEMHLAISPALLGSGENLLAGIDLLKLGYQCTEHVPTENATHVVLTKQR